VKFEFVRIYNDEAHFVLAVNGMLTNGWVRSGPVIVAVRGAEELFYQAFEKTGVGNE
jgi:hypothetical protein